MTTASHYNQLLNRDGSLNTAVYSEILARNIEAETNLALCVRARLYCPRHVLYRETRDWYAEQAATLPPSLLSAAERADIAHEQRRHLDDLVEAMHMAAVEACRQIAIEDAAE